MSGVQPPTSAQEVLQLAQRYVHGEVTAEDYFAAIEVYARALVEAEVRGRSVPRPQSLHTAPTSVHPGTAPRPSTGLSEGSRMPTTPTTPDRTTTKEDHMAHTTPENDPPQAPGTVR